MAQQRSIERVVRKANCLEKFANCLLKLSGLLVNEAQKPMPYGIIWVEFYSFPARRHSFLIFPRPIQDQSKEGLAINRHWFKLPRPLRFRDSFAVPSLLRQPIGIPRVGNGIARVQFESALVLGLRSRPVPVKTLADSRA